MRPRGIFQFGLPCCLLFVTSCSGSATVPAVDPLAGQYSASGGGGALLHVRALTKRFSELHPEVVWAIENVGSDASVTLVARGEVDLGFTSRDLTTEEQELVAERPMGAVGTAVAVNVANPVSGLTTYQVRQIFSGQITRWDQVGGTAGGIRVLIREQGAATRSSFESHFFVGKPVYTPTAVEMNRLEEMMTAIGSLRDAVGMVTLSDRTLARQEFRLLAIDGIPATKENLYSGAYRIRRPLHLIFHPDPNKVKPAIRAFLDFVQSADGQQVLEDL